MNITVKYLGGLRQEMGMASCTFSLPDNATVADLETHLRAQGMDLDGNKNIVVLNQRGLDQWPPDQRLAPADAVLIIPNIAGG